LVGFLAPPEDDEDGFATAVLKGYAGDPGRFSQEIRDRLGAAYKASVEYEPRLRAGSLIVCAAVTPGSEESALKALREEIQRVHDGPISYKDFRSGVNEAVGAYSIQQQVRSVQIDAIAEYVLLGKGLETYENYPAGLKDVREEDLKAIAQRIFDLDKAVILVLRGKDKS
jgi:predicted Zn-dependent peptidase